MNIRKDLLELKFFSKEFGIKLATKHYIFKKPLAFYKKCYLQSENSTGFKRILYRKTLPLFRMFRDHYINLVYGFYENVAQPIIDKYNEEPFPKADECQSKNVWICWWQGLDSMPSLCKMCYDNLCRNVSDEYNVQLITQNNYSQYVEIPDHVIERLESGILTITQFSDILREALLYYQGGLWIDCSVWTTPDFYRFINTEQEFWSVKLPNVYKEYVIGQVITECKWAGFFMYGKKGNVVTKFAFDCMCKYYRDYSLTFDYFIQNIFIKIGYNNISYIRNIIDDIPLSNPRLYALRLELNNIFKKQYWKEMTSDTGVFKLSQKVQYKEEIDGKTTFYGHLKAL